MHFGGGTQGQQAERRRLKSFQASGPLETQKASPAIGPRYDPGGMRYQIRSFQKVLTKSKWWASTNKMPVNRGGYWSWFRVRQVRRGRTGWGRPALTIWEPRAGSEPTRRSNVSFLLRSLVNQITKDHPNSPYPWLLRADLEHYCFLFWAPHFYVFIFY